MQDNKNCDIGCGLKTVTTTSHLQHSDYPQHCSPMIEWATKLASKWSTVEEHLVQALALHTKQQKACPLTPIHITGKRNAISLTFPLDCLEATRPCDAIPTTSYSLCLTPPIRYPCSNRGQFSSWSARQLRAWFPPCGFSLSEAHWQHWKTNFAPMDVISLWHSIRRYNQQRLSNKLDAFYGIRAMHLHRILWLQTTGPGCNSYRRNHGRWADDIHGPWPSETIHQK